MRSSSRFQFHKGAIRTSVKVLTDITEANFNSIKVRLELIRDSFSAGSTAFQFHKGAIRTSLPDMSTKSVIIISIP